MASHHDESGNSSHGRGSVTSANPNNLNSINPNHATVLKPQQIAANNIHKYKKVLVDTHEERFQEQQRQSHVGIEDYDTDREHDDDDMGRIEDDYSDVKLELQAIGHHLVSFILESRQYSSFLILAYFRQTSVLLNPRETLLENLFDEFAIEQSAPLESQSSSSSILSSISQHPIISAISSHAVVMTSSHHTSNSSNHSSLGGSLSGALTSSSHRNATASQMLTLTQAEIESLQRFMLKIHKLYEIYISAHLDYESRSPGPRNQRNKLSSIRIEQLKEELAGVDESQVSKSKR
jgi:hypothetical protein